MHHACAIRSDGTLRCWGWDDQAQVRDVPSGVFRAVGSGVYHSCAIDLEGSLQCWGCEGGRPEYGQCDPPPSP